jgi:hypothetical protein
MSVRPGRSVGAFKQELLKELKNVFLLKNIPLVKAEIILFPMNIQSMGNWRALLTPILARKLTG